jgi:hypothetical protein
MNNDGSKKEQKMNSNRDDILKEILAQLAGGGAEPDTHQAEPKPVKVEPNEDAATRDENLRVGFFMKANGSDIVDADTRAAAIRQINAALKTL